MSKRTYIVKEGDTLSSIAQSQYGNESLWPKIFKANETRIISDDPNKIIPGTVLVLPEIDQVEELKEEKAPAKLKKKNILTVLIDEKEIKPESASILRTMDTIADGFNISMAWQKFPEPFQYNKIKIYLSGELVITGIVYSVEPFINASGNRKTLEGGSFTIDLVDSTLNASDYEQSKVGLFDRAQRLLSPKGIKVISETNLGGPFERVTANPTETIFSHLAKLAMERGVLMSSNTEGNLLFSNANIDGKPVATLREQNLLPNGTNIKYDGRLRFNVYKAIGQSPGSNENIGIATDNEVPRSRFKTFQANDNLAGEMNNVAKWIKNKAIGEGTFFEYPVVGWLDPLGNLWRENTIVTVINETLHIPKGKNFLIKQVKYDYNASGCISYLSLVDPLAYSKV
jgi:prophage tail gpP-like protein